MSICVYVCVCMCVYVCLFTFEVPFKRLSAPSSQSQMFKIFRDSEFLGKSSGKKWCQIWKFVLIKSVKLPWKKKVSFWTNFALLSRIFLVSVFFTQFNSSCAPTSWIPIPKHFRFSESLGKGLERSDLRFENFCS